MATRIGRPQPYCRHSNHTCARPGEKRGSRRRVAVPTVSRLRSDQRQSGTSPLRALAKVHGPLGLIQYWAGHPLFYALGASQLDRTICISTAYAGWRANAAGDAKRAMPDLPPEDRTALTDQLRGQARHLLAGTIEDPQNRYIQRMHLYKENSKKIKMRKPYEISVLLS